MSFIEGPPEPCRSFFAEVDSRLSEEVHLHVTDEIIAAYIANPQDDRDDDFKVDG
jgi:hypothetical protein